jgi:hypothetical protein
MHFHARSTTLPCLTCVGSELAATFPSLWLRLTFPYSSLHVGSRSSPSSSGAEASRHRGFAGLCRIKGGAPLPLPRHYPPSSVSCTTLSPSWFRSTPVRPSSSPLRRSLSLLSTAGAVIPVELLAGGSLSTEPPPHRPEQS